jgi:hypothetical protein
MTPDKGPNCGAYPMAGSGSEGVSDSFVDGVIGGVKNVIGRFFCTLMVGDMVGAATTMKSSTTSAYFSTILRDNRPKPRIATS